MATVLHRTQKTLIRSVNSPDYPTLDWIHNPDLSLVEGQPTKYWTITGDVVSLMTAPERQVVDDAEREAVRDATVAVLDQIENYSRAFALVFLDESNLHAQRITDILNAADAATNLAGFKARIALIADAPQRTIAQIKTAVQSKLGS